MCDHFVLHQYICGTTLYCTVYFTSTYLDHFVLQQYVYTSSVGLSACVTTLYCTVTVYLINTYVGLLCIASVPMWDHFVLYCLPHQYLCGTTLHCISTYVGPLCIAPFISPDHFVLHCLLHQYLFGPLCIATVGICLISRPTYMWDHFDCLPHQYLCVTTLYCISTYVGPLCIALFTSPVPIWTTLYCNSMYIPHQ